MEKTREHVQEEFVFLDMSWIPGQPLDRFRFDLSGDGKAEAVPDYSYNWPYDFCSLVERAKVDVSVTLKKPEEEE